MFQLDAYVCITCRSLIEREQKTGKWSAAKRLAMVHELYTGQVRIEIDDKKGRRQFKYVEDAEYMSRYPKHMDMSNENSTTVSDDVRWAIYVNVSRNAERKSDGVETGTRKAQIDEESIETEKESINTDGGEEISKEISTEHTQGDRTEVRQVVVAERNGGGRGARQEPSKNANVLERIHIAD